MKRINIYIVCAALGISLLSTACSDQLDQVNPNAATEATFWKNESDFTSALTACYTPLKVPLNGGYYGTRGVMMRIARADEVDFRNDISEVYQAYNFTNSNGNSLSQGLFYQFYNGIYRCNTVMQKLTEKADVLSKDFIQETKAECLFLRGLYLFQLGKEFKDAPLRLTASQSVADFPLKKSTQKEIWDQAIADLTEAAPLLPMQQTVKVKPTRGAAYALLGKIYLYEEEFDKAISVLEPLTKSPYSYSLVKDFRWNCDADHEYNSESIFEIPMEDVGGTDVWSNGETNNTRQTTSRAEEYAAPEVGGWYEANPTAQMMKIMTQEKDKDGNYDYRARVSVAWDYDGCYYYLKPFREKFAQSRWNTTWILKYQNWDAASIEDPTPKSMINERALRYDGVILNLAECYLRSKTQQNLSKAVAYINMIRERANLNDYQGGMNYSDIFSDLEHQRAIEFFVEGERFYDLRRWGLLEERMKTCSELRYKQLETGKTGNTNKYYYYPIPSAELETNDLCTPNEGW
ncbi:MAG: RagB/SusD family nutrient uptake outer membrane protein [Prevotella sp.]|jgi:tetratricopeptide (TPR) repeat protein|nr:RagB/SusD family nutrient uptake outer membrane protein [Prevotella sp.]MCI2079385.1 RagB/SusD family nutrient uptake outer membrane protein [Prevotella sp.]MCI2101184.1 RagB/SusD family nutrient uptake outer membrane protein [Prevotella sp.]